MIDQNEQKTTLAKMFLLAGLSVISFWLIAVFSTSAQGQHDLVAMSENEMVTIDGPTSGLLNTPYTFTATLTTLTGTVTLPLTYTWQATDQSPITQVMNLSSTVSFDWNSTGRKTITVTAAQVVDTHTIDIGLTHLLYLPLVAKTILLTKFDYGIQPDPSNDPAFNIGHVRALGLRWVKFQMSWKDVEPDPGDFRWERWDQIINAYNGAGIKILLSVSNAPNWARPDDDDKSVEGPSHDPQTYARFVGTVAARYTGKVQAIEIWDEQNVYYQAGGPGRVNVDNYMALLRAAHIAIKQANSAMIVVSGGLLPTGAPHPWAVDDVAYLRQMYERGLRNYSDAIGARPSGFANPPDAYFTGGDYDPSRGYDDHRSFFFRNTYGRISSGYA